MLRTTVGYSASLAALLLAFGASAQAPAQAQNPARFSVSADGQEVLDTQTNLIWRRCPEGAKWDGKTCAGKPARFKLADAKAVAAGAAKADGKEWRIPNRADLEALIMKGQKRPLIHQASFPATPTKPFWALRDGYSDNLNAWIIDFSNGHVFGSTGSKHFLRLVRNKT